jgi:ribosome maturation factor RimP
LSKKEVLAKVQELVLPIIAERDLELFDLELAEEPAGWFLRVFVDAEGGVDVETCAEVSEVLSEKLDLIEGLPEPYTLEVSSPGIERPLRKRSDYERFLGQRIYVKSYAPVNLPGGKKAKELTGRLVAVEDEEIVLESARRQVRIALSSIAKAHLLVEF